MSYWIAVGLLIVLTMPDQAPAWDWIKMWTQTSNPMSPTTMQSKLRTEQQNSRRGFFYDNSPNDGNIGNNGRINDRGIRFMRPGDQPNMQRKSYLLNKFKRNTFSHDKKAQLNSPDWKSHYENYLNSIIAEIIKQKGSVSLSNPPHKCDFIKPNKLDINCCKFSPMESSLKESQSIREPKSLYISGDEFKKTIDKETPKEPVMINLKQLEATINTPKSDILSANIINLNEKSPAPNKFMPKVLKGEDPKGLVWWIIPQRSPSDLSNLVPFFKVQSKQPAPNKDSDLEVTTDSIQSIKVNYHKLSDEGKEAVMLQLGQDTNKLNSGTPEDSKISHANFFENQGNSISKTSDLLKQNNSLALAKPYYFHSTRFPVNFVKIQNGKTNKKECATKPLCTMPPLCTTMPMPTCVSLLDCECDDTGSLIDLQIRERRVLLKVAENELKKVKEELQLAKEKRQLVKRKLELEIQNLERKKERGDSSLTAKSCAQPD